MTEQKHIVLVNFDFPPNSGIGGRRWAKFARYLAENNVLVHVIKANPLKGDQPSIWANEVKHENILIRSLERPLPQFFTHPSGQLWDKVRYRIYKNKLRARCLGTIYDQAIDWESTLVQALTDITQKHPISTIIASGAPFNLLYYVAKFKAQHKDLQFIADYRDPWLSARNYGMPELNDEQMAHEVQKQNEVLTHADIVFSPYLSLSKKIEQENTKGLGNAMYLELAHCYDPANLPPQKSTTERESDTYTIVYGGALYQGAEEQFDRLDRCLNELQVISPQHHEKIRIECHSSDYLRLKARFAHQEKILFKAAIGKELFHRIDESSAAMILLSEHNQDFKTTKFYEFLSRKKPIMYLGPKGEVAQFLEQHNLGINVESAADLINLMDNKAWSDYDLSQHELNRLGKNLLSYLR